MFFSYSTCSILVLAIAVSISCGSKDKGEGSTPDAQSKAPKEATEEETKEAREEAAKELEKAAAAKVDAAAPVPGAGPTFSNVTSRGYTVSWAAATDDKSLADKLQYTLVSADFGADLLTIEGAESITGAGVDLDWTPGVLSKAVSGKQPGALRSYAVLVKDEAGKIALYPPQSVTTLTDGAPTPGSGIVFSNRTTAGFTASWGAATDLEGTALSYKVVWGSTSAEIDSIDEIEAKMSQTSGWQSGTSFALTGLLGATEYYVSVLVKDADDEKAVYSPTRGWTTHKRFYYSTQTFAGNWGGDFTIADTSCQGDTQNPGGTFKAMVSIGNRNACTTAACSSGGVADQANWVLQPFKLYGRVNGDPIFKTDGNAIIAAGEFYSFLGGPLEGSWSGLKSDGTRLDSADNCSGWTVNSGVSAKADNGFVTYAQNWIGSKSVTCAVARSFLCVEQ